MLLTTYDVTSACLIACEKYNLSAEDIKMQMTSTKQEYTAIAASNSGTITDVFLHHFVSKIAFKLQILLAKLRIILRRQLQIKSVHQC